MERYLKSGDGWRVGWHPHAGKYQGLVGSDDWAIELTPVEFDDFYRLLKQLSATMAAMQAQLMEQEKISCEAETDLLWLEAEGYPHSYSLRLIIHGDRRCEGNWHQGTAPLLLNAIESSNIGTV